MTASEKVAYLKGLMEGLGIETDKGEGKLFAAIADVLEDLAYGQEELEESIGELEDGLDAVSDDLEDVEDLVFGDDDECGCDDEDECCCGHHHHGRDEDLEYEVQCPACGEDIVLDEDDLEAGVIECPSCGETLELDLTAEECECDDDYDYDDDDDDSDDDDEDSDE